MPISDQRFAELLKSGAEKLAEAQSELQDALDDATMYFLAPGEPPSVAKILQQSNMHSIVQVLSQFVRSPGKTPEPVLTDDILELIETRVRHGTAELTLKGFRVGRAVAWRLWMKIAFKLSDDPDEILSFLDRSSILLNDYIEQTIELIGSHIKRIKTELEEGTPTSHRKLITAILDGQQLDPIFASRRIAYTLSGSHQALVLWKDSKPVEQLDYNLFMDDLIKQPHIGATFGLLNQDGTFWVWFSGEQPAQLSEFLSRHDLRATIGTRQKNMDGFALTHRQALAAQVISRQSIEQPILLAYECSRLPILLLKDREAFKSFSSEVLGALHSADRVYQDSLLAYLEHGCNLVQTAQELGIHRNTLQKRLDRAEDMLPETLNTNTRLQIGAALSALQNA